MIRQQIHHTLEGNHSATFCPNCGSHDVIVFKRFMAKGTPWSKLWGCNDCESVFETPYHQNKGYVCSRCLETLKKDRERLRLAAYFARQQQQIEEWLP